MTEVCDVTILQVLYLEKWKLTQGHFEPEGVEQHQQA